MPGISDYGRKTAASGEAQAIFVFVGAGGGSLPLLIQKLGTPDEVL
jgi:L-2-hydroxyglutarate oxidase LhgO